MKALNFLVLFFLLRMSLAQTIPFETWLKREISFSKTKIIESMSYADLVPGAIIASPSKSNPDYYYHWVRDAALVADVLIDLYSKSNDTNEKNNFRHKINDYISFSGKNQNAPALTGFGEPKFYVDGSPFSLPWGRPQNDGPALRALALIKWAHIKISEGHFAEVKNELYDSEMPANTIIKRDLEYVAARWQDASFDLWEEVLGDHFFTRYVQREALLSGAQLAQKLGDFGASDWYLKQAQQIEVGLKKFTNSKLMYIPATLNIPGNENKSKVSNLDSAILLSLLRAPSSERSSVPFLRWDDRKMIKTIDELVRAFTLKYDVNRTNLPGVAIGRYPEDVYDGGPSLGGNPWVLTTLAVAETYYERSSIELNKTKAKTLIDTGDAFFQRVQAHANEDGSLSEQIQRSTGKMTSANNLTWNYAAILTTHWARERARLKVLNK